MTRTCFFQIEIYKNYHCVSREKCPQHMWFLGSAMAGGLVMGVKGREGYLCSSSESPLPSFSGIPLMSHEVPGYKE
jgi:hypothetical protein